jgi:hypothetical protein
VDAEAGQLISLVHSKERSFADHMWELHFLSGVALHGVRQAFHFADEHKKEISHESLVRALHLLLGSFLKLEEDAAMTHASSTASSSTACSSDSLRHALALSTASAFPFFDFLVQHCARLGRRLPQLSDRRTALVPFLHVLQRTMHVIPLFEAWLVGLPASQTSTKLRFFGLLRECVRLFPLPNADLATAPSSPRTSAAALPPSAMASMAVLSTGLRDSSTPFLQHNASAFRSDVSGELPAAACTCTSSPTTTTQLHVLSGSAARLDSGAGSGSSGDSGALPPSLVLNVTMTDNTHYTNYTNCIYTSSTDQHRKSAHQHQQRDPTQPSLPFSFSVVSASYFEIYWTVLECVERYLEWLGFEIGGVRHGMCVCVCVCVRVCMWE